jgi:AGZA family xanthine/uracil permease-like MFS transporter
VGLIHGEAIGFGQSLPVACSYLVVAGILFFSAKYAEIMPASEEIH